MNAISLVHYGLPGKQILLVISDLASGHIGAYPVWPKQGLGTQAREAA